MHGGNGPDYMEGNHGSDFMLGDDGEDDMIGGSSAGDGVIGGPVLPFELADGHDVMLGGDEDDVMLADNAQIHRPLDGDGLWELHDGFGFNLAVRETIMSTVPENAGAFGDDYMRGDNDHDDMYGQQGHDYMEGNNGQDAMVGDLGRILNTVEDGSREEIIAPPGPFFSEAIYVAGTFTRQVELFSFLQEDGAAGNDVMLGGDDRDSIHAGPGHDLVNGDGDSTDGTDPVPGTTDEDRIYGGDGDDVMWGGRDEDHIWGGYGEDHIDIRPRVATEVTVPDTPEWFIYGEPDNFQGHDIIYGGWGRDAMQANVAIPGPPNADRLIDWVGGYDVFYVCPGAYGEGTITRTGNPHFRRFLQELAEAEGAFDTRKRSSSGFREVAYVFPNERGDNSHPPHPDHPGHFVCDDGEVDFGSSTHVDWDGTPIEE